MVYCRTSFNVSATPLLVTRPTPLYADSVQPLQVLVWSEASSGRGFYYVNFADGNLGLAGQLPLSTDGQVRSSDGQGDVWGSGAPPQRAVYTPQHPAYAAMYEPRTDAVYFSAAAGLMRLDSHGDVSVVAGVPQEKGSADGPANTARFESINAMAADGEGALVVAEGPRLRRVQVWVRPEEEEERAAGAVAACTDGSGLQKLRRTDLPRAVEKDAQASTPTDTRAANPRVPGRLPDFAVQVSTLHTRSDSATWTAVAFDAVTGAFVATTATAVYRLRLPPCSSSLTATAAPGRVASDAGAPAAGSAATSQAPSPATPKPLLVAGLQGSGGTTDASYSAARFQAISGVTVDRTGGTAWVTDSGRLRRVDLVTGCVTTPLADLHTDARSPVVLPNGCLAYCSPSNALVVALMLGLPPAPPPQHDRLIGNPAFRLPPPLRYTRLAPGVAAAAAAAAFDPTADMVMHMSDGTRFTAHRAVLAAASEYFWSWFYGFGFTESSGAAKTPCPAEPQDFELPDADSEAFAVVLHCCYSTAYSRAPPQPHDLLPPHVLPPRLLRPVAELADRLLLPGLLAEATHRLLAATWPDTVADDMVWAEARSPGCEGLMGRLLEGLQAFHARHAAAVMTDAPDSVRRLALGNPALMAELYLATVSEATAAGARASN